MGLCLSINTGYDKSTSILGMVGYIDTFIIDPIETTPWRYKCGDGICDTENGETDESCSIDCKDIVCPDSVPFECFTGFFIEDISGSPKKCVKKCKIGYYGDTQLNLCKLCHSTC